MNFKKEFSEGKTGRHETFFPRFNWLKKGYDCCKINPHVFNDDNAIEQLGVGKNMVRSIRFWSQSFGILKLGLESGCLEPTDFGDQLLDDVHGWDPYLEDPASLWLLHWKLFNPPFLSVSWNIAFSFVMLSSFNIQELTKAILSKYRQFAENRKISEGTIKRDAACIIRMYSMGKNKDSELQSPFSDLKLIAQPVGEDNNKYYCFSQEQKLNLPDLLFLSAVLEYASIWFSEQKSLSLSQISYGPNSPGMVFRLSETDCGSRLERICSGEENLIFTETNGVRQIQLHREPEELSQKFLKKYYGDSK